MSDPDVIFRGVHVDEMALAVRAARWLMERPQQDDAILVYGEGDDQRHFYVRRGKAIIVRPV